MEKYYKRIIAGLLTAAMMIPVTCSFAEPMRASGYELLGETTFDRKIVPWLPTESSPARQEFDLDEGAAHMLILVPYGANRSQWDLQFVYRGLDFQKGHEYKVSFKVKSKRAGMEICSFIGNPNDTERYFVLDGQEKELIMGPHMGGMWGSALRLSTEFEEFTGIFTPTDDITGAVWSFRYAKDDNGYGGNAQAGDEIWFDDMSVEDLTDPDYVPPKQSCGYTSRGWSGLENNYISVNQLGYFPHLAKTAVLGDDQGDLLDGAQSISLSGKYDYEIVDAASGTVAYTGKTEAAQKDTDSGDTVCKIDFTEFDTPGEYYIRIKGKAWRSFPFRISTDIYGGAEGGLLTNALNYFYQNRAGTDIAAQYITSGEKSELAHAENPDEAIGIVQNQWTASGISSVTHAEYYESSRIDVSGGWYTGSEYEKYMTEGGFAVWTLQNLYERALESAAGGAKFADGSGAVIIPENGNKIPDILDECRYELDFMKKMKVQPDEKTWGEYAGLYYHGMKGLGFRPDMPDYEHEYHAAFAVQPPSFAATLNFAACAAQGARLWAPYDAAYAAKLFADAKEAYQAYRHYYYEASDREEYAEKSLYASSRYFDSDYDVSDEAYWAACELYLTAMALDDADADTYLKSLSEYIDAFKLKSRAGHDSTYGTYTLRSGTITAAAGTLSLALHKNLLTDAQKMTLTDSIISVADEYIKTENEQGYGIPYQYDGPGYAEYYSGLAGEIYWGYENSSNVRAANNLMAMAYAYDLTGDAAYLNGAVKGMNYLLGCNPLAFSFVTGCGEYAAKNPANRYWKNEIDKTLPAAPDGVLVSGPSAVYLDSYMRALGFQTAQPDDPSQRYYADSTAAYSVNDAALDSNAALAWAVSFLNDAAAAVAADASGDVSADGKTDAADAVLLQRWLLGDPKAELADWQAGDLNGNGRLSAADLSLLKRALPARAVRGSNSLRAGSARPTMIS